MTRLALLVCNTRTGSTALGSALEHNNPNIFYIGEAFVPDSEDATSFAAWLHRTNTRAVDFIKNKEAIVHEYIRQTLDSMDVEIAIWDVKYHDLPSLMPVPALLDFPPVIFGVAAEMGIGAIHLARRDKLLSALSQYYAEMTHIHHVRLGEAVPKVERPQRIGPVILAHQVRMRVLQEVIVDRQLEYSRCPYLKIHYEDVFPRPTDNVLEKLRDFMGFDVSIEDMLYEKIAPTYEDVISNYEEVAEEAKKWNNIDWRVRDT